jgi:DNA gyrase inhibitor GyrI
MGVQSGKQESGMFRGFGIYYDNPQKVEKDKLRSDLDSILENPTYGSFSQP